MKKFVWLQRPRTEADLRTAILLYHEKMGQPGSIQNETFNGVASFRKRLLTCILRDGKKTDNKKWRKMAERLNHAEEQELVAERPDLLNDAAEADDEELDEILLELVE